MKISQKKLEEFARIAKKAERYMDSVESRRYGSNDYRILNKKKGLSQLGGIDKYEDEKFQTQLVSWTGKVTSRNVSLEEYENEHRTNSN